MLVALMAFGMNKKVYTSALADLCYLLQAYRRQSMIDDTQTVYRSLARQRAGRTRPSYLQGISSYLFG